MALEIRRTSPIKIRVLSVLLLVFGMLLQPIVALDVPEAFAASLVPAHTVLTLDQATGFEKTNTFTTLGYENIKVMFHFDSTTLDGAQDEYFEYGYIDGSAAKIPVGSVPGVNGLLASESGDRQFSLPTDHNNRASVGLYFKAVSTAGQNADHVEITDIAVSGDVLVSVDTPLDTSAPDFAIVSPASESTVHGTVDIKAYVTDASGIKKLLMTVSTKTGNKTYVFEEGKSNNTLTKNGDVYSVAIDTKSLNDGNVHVVLRGTDGAGNTRYWNNNAATRQHGFTVDNALPEVTNVILNGKSVNIAREENCGPVDFNLISGKVNLGSTITDLSGVKSATYKIRKVTEGGCTQTGIYQSGTVALKNQSGNEWVTLESGEIDTAADANLVDGNYTIMMTVTDNAGNVATKYVDITVDNTAPGKVTGLKAFTSEGEVVGGVTKQYFVTIKWDAVDDAANYEYCYWNDILAASVYREENCYMAYPLSNQQSGEFNQGEGMHHVKVRAVDTLGNKGEWSDAFDIFYLENEAAVVSENFNTHNGSDYKGLNVGFNIANFNEVTGVTVELFDNETAMVANTHNQALLDLINNDNTTQLSTPFITVSGTYAESFWNLGSYEWASDSPRPTHALVTVTGKNKAGQTVTKTALLTNLSETEGSAYENILPQAEPQAKPEPTLNRSNQNSNSGRSGPAALIPGIIANIPQPFQQGFIGNNPNTEVITDEGDDDTAVSSDNESNDDSDILGEQDDESAALKDTGEVLGLMDQKFFGIAWYWYLVILAALVGGWLLIAAAIRRGRETDV